jgi:hypothetical protein
MSFVESFVADLAAVRLDSVFNPYADQCPECDLPNASNIRRANLVALLTAADRLELTTAWLGRDLGYRGGRRTGLALTDEPHLSVLPTVYTNTRVRRATVGSEVSERTATEVWRMIAKLPSPPFLWNVFPFHPYEERDPFTNRAHSPRERDTCVDILASLLAWLKPQTIVAIGEDAHRTLKRLGHSCVYIRHPSYGGKADFVRGVSELYNLPADPAPRAEFRARSTVHGAYQ